MDTITDFLSTYFVNEKHRSKRREVKKKEHNKKKQTEKVIQEEAHPTTDHQPPVSVDPIDEIVKESSKEHQDTSDNTSEDTFTSTSSEPELSEEAKDSRPDEEEVIIDTKFPKKYIMKANEMANKHIVVVNKEVEENLCTIGDFLHMMSLMKGVDEKYSSDTYIITSNEHKKLFKQMLLENPYLHFTNFIVKHSLTKAVVDHLLSNPKRTIVFLDMDHTDPQIVQRALDLQHEKVQLVALSTQYKDVASLFPKLNDNKLLIHRKERLKSLQKVFFKQVLQPLCAYTPDFENYFYMMNHDNFGVRYIIIKTDELRYN